MHTPAVTAERLRLSYDGEAVVSIDELEIPFGGVVALIGPNGSGKSTLLSAIAGVLRPASGAITVLGDRPDAARRQVAYVLQSTPAAAALPVTVREVVTMGRYAHRGLLGRMDGHDRHIIAEVLDRLEIAHLSNWQMWELSGGQRQQVLVAQGLAQQARMLLLDEPLTGLDVVSQQRISRVIREERDRGATVVLATHDLGEAQRADFVVLLARGGASAGTPAEVLTPNTLATAYGGGLFHITGEGAMLDEHVHPGQHGPTHRNLEESGR